MLLGLKLMLGATPLPSGFLLSSPLIWNGAVAAVFRPKSSGKGSTSNTANPPFDSVFPSLNGSHENPTRGSKFLVVGLFLINVSTCCGPHGLLGLGATPGVAQLTNVVI